MNLRTHFIRQHLGPKQQGRRYLRLGEGPGEGAHERLVLVRKRGKHDVLDVAQLPDGSIGQSCDKSASSLVMS